MPIIMYWVRINVNFINDFDFFFIIHFIHSNLSNYTFEIASTVDNLSFEMLNNLKKKSITTVSIVTHVNKKNVVMHSVLMEKANISIK